MLTAAPALVLPGTALNVIPDSTTATDSGAPDTTLAPTSGSWSHTSAGSRGRWFEPRLDSPPGSDGHGPATSQSSGAGPEDGYDRLVADYQHLQRRLQTLPAIEQAKGVLVARYGIDPETAFGLLRRWSSHTNHKLRDISRLLVDTAAQPVDAAEAPISPLRRPTALDHLIAHLDAGSLPASRHQQQAGATRTDPTGEC